MVGLIHNLGRLSDRLLPLYGRNGRLFFVVITVDPNAYLLHLLAINPDYAPGRLERQYGQQNKEEELFHRSSIVSNPPASRKMLRRVLPQLRPKSTAGFLA